jgi:REP element-mobilizing transposase RayT
MSHLRRKDAPDRVFHITSRVNWSAWHLDDEHAKRELARLLTEAADTFSVALLAAVFMANHFHAVVQSPLPDRYCRLTGRRTGCRHFRPWPKHHQNSSVIAQYMRTVRRKLSVRRQNALGLSGRFWESRYDARIVSDPFSLVVRIAYDHRNPVKQSLVPRPEAYTWSTANEWATGEEGDIPICLQGPLPFGLSFDSLRRSVIHYQQSKALDDCGEEIEKFLASGEEASPDALRALLEEHGVPCECGTAAAER